MNDPGKLQTKTHVLLIGLARASYLEFAKDLKVLACNMVETFNLEEAAKLLSRNQFIAILVDIRYLEDGLNLPPSFLDSQLLRTTPLIFFGAPTSCVELIEKAYASGAVDVLMLPHSTFILQTKVRFALTQFQYRQADSIQIVNERTNAETEKSQLLENSLDAVVGVAPDQTIVYWNRHAEIIFGWSKYEAVGQSMVELIIPERYREAHNKRMTRFLDAGEPTVLNKRIEMPALRKTRGEFIVELTVTYTKTVEGSHRFYSFIRDISDKVIMRKTSADLKAAILEAELARDEAQRANQLKSDFLANMSHEIRTPLGAMLGFADLLRDQGLTHEEQINYIDVLSRNGESLSVIINDILDLSKVEAGHLSLEFTDAYPEQIVRDVTSLLQVKAKQKHLSLECTSDFEKCPISLVSDPTRVRQVLLNLVGNAIKFTGFGSVRIHASGELDSNGCQSVSFDITDSGIGIAPDQAKKIFEMFVQADGSMTRRYGGTGLGLALSRKLARGLGGDVRILQTVEGKGTTFRATFRDMPENRNVEIEPTRLNRLVQSRRSAQGSLQGIRVLVVDDAPDNQQLIRRYLTKQGAIVECAENGLIGYRAAVNGEFDVVLMDIQMPVMDGFTATQSLRKSGYRKPIIALTAHAMTEVRRKALFVGYSDHLPKPINPRELIDSILQHTRTAH